MKKYEFKVIFLDRIQLRDEFSEATATLNGFGAQGWHIVLVREDARSVRDLALFLERESGE